MTSGFGKVILVGEHAVVYGHPALAGALSVTVDASAERGQRTSLSVPQWNLSMVIDEPNTAVRAKGESNRLPRAITSLIKADGHSLESFEITVSSALPSRAGLGSSAAFCVAITRALAACRGETLSTADVERRANAGETCFHETPSGVDVALAARGGLGVFRTGAPFKPLTCAPFQLLIGQTGEPRQTGDMVRAVARAREHAPEACNGILARLGQLATTGAEAVVGADLDSLGATLNEAQSLLKELGVSSSGIDALVSIARENGALGCKLTGAGGGGSVIALVPGREEVVAKAWKQRGFSSIVATLGSANFSTLSAGSDLDKTSSVEQ